MYIEQKFRQHDHARILAFIKAHSFATLVSTRHDRPFATHLPLLIETRDNQLYLRGHLARANSQWQQLQENPQALVMFQGPHYYISPTYYRKPGVPTWNYVAVHAYGQARVVIEAAEIKDIIEQLTAINEIDRPDPWQPDYPASMLEAIIGIEIRVDNIEAKYKLSQNRSPADRAAVIENLGQLDDPDAQAIADLMNQQ